MHVLFIPSWYPAHPGDINGCFFREQAQALAASGLRLGVITPAFRSLTTPGAVLGSFGMREDIDAGVPTLRYHGVRAWSWHHGLNLRFWEHTGLRAFERYVASHGRPDVIHVHGMIHGLAWGAAIRRHNGIPFVVTEHSTEFAIGTIRPALLAYLTGQVRLASRTLAVSGDLCARLRELVPPAAPMAWTPMPNLVAADFGVPAARRHERPVGPLRLLNVGMLLPKKGQRRLLEAVRLLIDGGLDATLRICGAGPEEEALRELIRTLKLEDRVELLGNRSREQVREDMAACDVFVLSSLYETFGVVVVEALASGKPVVATRCGGPQDIVEPGRDGVLVDKDSADALAAGIREVAGRLPGYDAADLRERCVARFSDAAFVGRHRTLYETVAGHSLSRPRGRS